MEKKLLFLVTMILMGNILQTNGFAIRVYKERRISPSRSTNVILDNKRDVLQLIKYINDYYAIRGRARYGRSYPVMDRTNNEQDVYRIEEYQDDYDPLEEDHENPPILDSDYEVNY